MRTTLFFFGLLWMSIALFACSGQFWGGAATGAGGGTLATGGGYELNAKRQMDRLRDDLDTGRINQAEFDIRKDQTQRLSLAY